MQKAAKKLLVEGKINSLTPKLLGELSAREYEIYLSLFRGQNMEKGNFAADF
jgi:hypothetical protein